MTVAGPGRMPTQLDLAREHVGRTFGPKTAKRLDRFGDGTLYVEAGGWARLICWFADFVVFALLAFIGLGVFALAFPDVPGGVALLIMLALLFGAPMLYGLLYGNGRALGAVLTGTRLVRVKDGGRIGAAGPWAMLVRTVLFPGMIIGVLSGGGYAPGSPSRTSIDEAATRRLHAAGYGRV